MIMRILKILGLAAAAGAASSVVGQLPTILPGELGQPISAAIVAAIAFVMNPPKKK